MDKVQQCQVPPDSFLHRYQDDGGFSDCYRVDVPGEVTQGAFVLAFYTSALFRIERTLLRYLASMPATDADAKRLASGEACRFSAWTVESRSASELLLADATGRTRSWFMVAPFLTGDGAPTTRLYFGSAVVARRVRPGRKPGMGWVFHAMLGFHRTYSRLLLVAATRGLRAA